MRLMGRRLEPRHCAIILGGFAVGIAPMVLRWIFNN